ncbi:MAG: GAF domain-containing protein [Anaerolineales bacterium]|nr:GAF domain-containing protein [Anaerolineales bacterium]
MRGWRLAPGQGLIGWVLQHNQSLLVSDTRNDDRFFAGVDEMTGLVSRSVLTVPLRTIQGNLGALQILDKQIDKFSEADLQLVEALADSVAAAIGNSRLFAAEREHRRLAEVLRDTATSLNQNLDLEQVLDFVLDNVKRIIPCDIVNIMLVDSGIAHIVRYHGFMDCANEDDVKALHFSIDDVPHFHRMITSMQPCIIPDTSQDPDWVQLVPTHYVHSYIGVPIQRGKRTIGFINIDNLTTNVVTATHAKQLQDFANQAAMAIRNAQLYQLSQQEVANRLAAEKEVQQQNEFLNMVMSSLTHPFYVVDVKDYSIIIANEAARKAGLPKGSTCYAVTHGRSTPCDGKEHPCPIKQILKTHQPATVEHLHHDSAGNQRNVMVYSYPIHDENGAITQIIEYTMDITEQVLSKQMLIQSEKFAATGKMAAAVAHEIKNPLQSLLGCLSLAQEAVKDGRETGKYFDVARDSVKRISGTVTQMRELYRPAAVNKEPVDINVLLDRMLTLIEKRCEESGVEIIWKPVKESLPLMLVFDEIHQVFLNLALNALEAMPNGGELHVETAFVEEPAGMQVVVADNGVGIAPDVLDHIFEPFYTTKSGGSGLGLATSFGIIKRHGGQIDVASKEGAGSAFTVWLPL